MTVERRSARREADRQPTDGKARTYLIDVCDDRVTTRFTLPLVIEGDRLADTAAVTR